jgi:hypothetical protein
MEFNLLMIKVDWFAAGGSLRESAVFLVSYLAVGVNPLANGKQKPVPEEMS